MAAQNLAGSILLRVRCDEVFTGGIVSGVNAIDKTYAWTFDSPTLTTDTNQVWSIQKALAASASDTYTLSALVDEIGRTIAFARVRELLVVNPNTVVGDDLTIDDAGSRDWTGGGAFKGAQHQTRKVLSNGIEHKVAMDGGMAVVASVNDQIKITNSGPNSIIYTLILVGALA